MSLDDATCPRCGYHLAGMIQGSQHDAWRITVQCSECGLELATRDCIVGFIPTPRWVFDGPRRGQEVRRWLSTSARILTPIQPWRTLTLSGEMSLLRLIGWWLSFYLIITAAGIGFTAWATYAEPENAYYGFVVLQFLQVSSYEINWPVSTADLWRSSIVWAVTGPILVFPIWFMSCGMLWLLPVTRKRCKIRHTHLVRLALYSSIPILAFVFVNPLAILLDVQLAFIMAIFLGALVVIYLPLWWMGALVCYLKMPHAPLVVFLMLIIAVLTEVTVFFLIQQGI